MNTQSNQAIQTKIFGHRGYPAKFPENSLAGFRYVVATRSMALNLTFI